MDEDILARLADSQRRDRVLDQFNRATLDDVAPIGGAEHGMKVLQELNEMQDLEREAGRKECPDR